MAHRQVCVCDGPAFAKGSQENLKSPGDSSAVSQRGEGTTGSMAALLLVSPLLIMGIGAVPVMGLPLSWEEAEYCVGKDFLIYFNLAWITLL